MTEELTIAEKLLQLYECEGFEVHTGWNPYHLNNWRDAQFTYLKKDGKPLNTGGGGLSWQEIPCIELIGKCISPRRILIIGNSFGWSTLLCSLVWPTAEVVAMDCGFLPPADGAQKLLAKTLSSIRNEPATYSDDPFFGINLTNYLSNKNGLKAKAVISTSPNDIEFVVLNHFSGKPDFVFIDGYHISPQVMLDFDGAARFADDNCVYLFHDIINWHLRDAFDACKSKSKLDGGLLWRTPSGMGLLYPPEYPSLGRVMSAFGGSECELDSLKPKIRRWKAASFFEQHVLQSASLKKIKDLIFK